MTLDTQTELRAFDKWRQDWIRECEAALYASLSADDRNALMAWSAWQASARLSAYRMLRRADDVRMV